jgi:hypothetical protein
MGRWCWAEKRADGAFFPFVGPNLMSVKKFSGQILGYFWAYLDYLTFRPATGPLLSSLFLLKYYAYYSMFSLPLGPHIPATWTNLRSGLA